MTNFEKHWAWFFTLLGWQWEYFPEDHRYKTVRPDFRVVIPHEHYKFSSYTLDVFLRRGLQYSDFSEFWDLLQFLRKEADVPFESPVQPALLGNNPGITLLDAVHGGWGFLSISPSLPADWKSLWRAARALTCHSVAQPVGGLR